MKKTGFDHHLSDIIDTFSSQLTIETQDQVLQDFYTSWNIPILTKQQVHELTDLLMKGMKKRIDDSKFKELFVFSKYQMETFLNFFADKTDYLDKVYPIVFSNAIGFALNFEDNSCLSTILNALIAIKKTSKCNQAKLLLLIVTEYSIKFSKEKLSKEIIKLLISILSDDSNVEQTTLTVSTLLLEKLYTDNDVENAKILIEMVTNSTKNVIDQRINMDDTIISRILSSRLNLFEPEVFNCLKVLSLKKESESVKGTFALFANVFVNAVTKEETTFKLPTCENSIPGSTFEESPTYESHEFSHDVKGKSLFETKIQGIDSSKDEKDFLSPKTKKIIGVVEEIFEKARSIYADLFFTTMGPVFADESLSLNGYIAFIYLLKMTSNSQNFSPFIFDAVINPTIFNPNITIFDPPEDFEDLAFIRQLAVEAIANKMPQYLPNILTKFVNHPFLFSECCMRIQGLIGAGVVFEDNVFKTLVIVENKFRKIYEDNEESREITITARSAIFFFIFSVMNNPAATVTCFSSNSFVDAFLTAFFEPSFLDIVFSKLKQVFQTVNSAVGQMADFIASVLKILKLSQDNTSTIRIATAMITCVVDSILLNPSVVNYSGGILKNAIEYVEVVGDEENQLFPQILQLSLQMFLHNEDFDFDQLTTQRISTIIKKIEGNDITEATRSKLLCFLSASQSVNTKFLSLIRKPSILTLMFSIYTAGGFFKELFKLMMDLCNFSSYNCIMMHKGEVDVLLCEIVANFPNSFTFRGCEINNFTDGNECLNLVIPLLSKIMSYKSSTIVAKKIMGIIVPHGDNYLPLANNFLQRFYQALKSLTVVESPISFPLGIGKKYFTMSGVSTQEFFTELTMTFWIKADSVLANQMNEKASIIRAYVNSKILFEIYIRQMNIYCEIQLPGRLNSFDVFSLTNSGWNLICIVFKRGPAPPRDAHISPVMIKVSSKGNSEKAKHAFIKSAVDGPDPITIEFGNNITLAETDVDKLLCVYQVSKFSLYQKIFSTDTCDSMFIAGINSPHPSEQIFSTIYGNVEQKYPFKEDFTEKELHTMIPNIVDIFYMYIPPETFIPVFGCLKNASPNYAKLLVSFVATCFGDKIRNVLDQIAYYLSKSPKEVLNFQLYQMFYGLLEVFTDEKDIFHFYDALLINGELWGRAPAQALQKICSNWSTALIEPLKENDFITDDFFCKFFVLYRRYFWIEKSEPAINSPYERDPALDMSMVLYFLDRFITEVIQIKPKEQIVKNYITNCIFCKDTKLAERLIGNIPFMLQCLQTPSIDLSNMMHLIDTKNHLDFIFLMLFTFQLIYPTRLYEESILLSLHMPENMTFKEVTSPEGELDHCSAFPIVLTAGLRNGYEIQVGLVQRYEYLANDCETCKKIISNPYWYIWFTLFILQIDPSLHIQMVEVFTQLLVYNFDVNVVETVFGMMDILRVTTKFPVNKIKALITLSICNAMRNNRESLPNLIDFCFSALFLRFQRTLQSESMINVGLESDFVEDWKASKGDERSEKLHDPSLFKKKLSFPGGDCCYRLYLTDWDKMPTSQQLLVGILRNLLEKTPLFTPILHVIQLISRYPKGGDVKKRLILQIVSDREFIVIQNLLTEKLKALEEMATHVSEFFTKHEQTLEDIRNKSKKLSDPGISLIENIKRQNDHLKGVIRKNAKKYMGHDSIWCDTLKFKWEKSSILLNNYDCLTMKQVIDVPKNFLKINKSPPQTAKVFTAYCITIKKEKPIKFAIQKKELSLYFQTKIVNLKTSKITAILQRRRRQLPTAIEIFTTNGKSYLIDFYPTKIPTILAAFKDMKVQTNNFVFQTESPAQFIKEMDLVGKWNSGELTNYEFLLLLNMYSGRSFNDINIYPIFPWTNVDIPSLPSNERNFDFPIAVQTEMKINQFKNQLSSLVSINDNTPKFLFGAGISAPIYVVSYLMRMEPFAKVFKELHSNESITADQLFTSPRRFFEQMKSTDQNRELVPEAFTLPEAFLSKEFGDMKPPEWASDPFEWTYINKKRLNSREMSPNIAKWVDLVFGSAQCGKEAVIHLNLYIPYIYANVWDNVSKDDVKQQNFIMEHILNLGSIPPQVFTEKLTYSPTFSKSSDLETVRHLKLKEKSAVSADFSFTGEQNQVLTLIINDGSVVKYTVNFLNRTVTKVNGKPVNVSQDYRVVCSEESSLVVSMSTGNVINVTKEKIKTQKIEDRYINFICEDGGDILTANANGNISIQNHASLSVYKTRINVFSDVITSVCFSATFRIVAIATADHNLSIYSTRTGFLINQQKLPNVAKALLITKNTGHILALTSHEVFILTNNGSIARSVAVEREADVWCTWTNQDGVDYVCSADKNGNIFVFEAYYPEKISSSATCGGRILSLKYDRRLMGVVAVTSTPRINFYPFS